MVVCVCVGGRREGGCGGVEEEREERVMVRGGEADAQPVPLVLFACCRTVVVTDHSNFVFFRVINIDTKTISFAHDP